MVSWFRKGPSFHAHFSLVRSPLAAIYLLPLSDNNPYSFDENTLDRTRPLGALCANATHMRRGSSRCSGPWCAFPPSLCLPHFFSDMYDVQARHTRTDMGMELDTVGRPRAGSYVVFLVSRVSLPPNSLANLFLLLLLWSSGLRVNVLFSVLSRSSSSYCCWNYMTWWKDRPVRGPRRITRIICSPGGEETARWECERHISLVPIKLWPLCFYTSRMGTGHLDWTLAAVRQCVFPFLYSVTVR